MWYSEDLVSKVTLIYIKGKIRMINFRFALITAQVTTIKYWPTISNNARLTFMAQAERQPLSSIFTKLMRNYHTDYSRAMSSYQMLINDIWNYCVDLCTQHVDVLYE